MIELSIPNLPLDTHIAAEFLNKVRPMAEPSTVLVNMLENSNLAASLVASMMDKARCHSERGMDGYDALLHANLYADVVQCMARITFDYFHISANTELITNVMSNIDPNQFAESYYEALGVLQASIFEIGNSVAGMYPIMKVYETSHKNFPTHTWENICLKICEARYHLIALNVQGGSLLADATYREVHNFLHSKNEIAIMMIDALNGDL